MRPCNWREKGNGHGEVPTIAIWILCDRCEFPPIFKPLSPFRISPRPLFPVKGVSSVGDSFPILIKPTVDSGLSSVMRVVRRCTASYCAWKRVGLQEFPLTNVVRYSKSHQSCSSHVISIPTALGVVNTKWVLVSTGDEVNRGEWGREHDHSSLQNHDCDIKSRTWQRRCVVLEKKQKIQSNCMDNRA